MDAPGHPREIFSMRLWKSSKRRKGSVLVFDELCDDIFPGETIALREILGLNQLKIQRLPMTARISYLEIE